MGGASALTVSWISIVAVWIVVIALTGIPVVKSMEVDEEFGLYGMMLFAFLAAFGNVWSFSRFLSFILPAWFTLRTVSKAALAAAIATFPIISLVIWYLFVIPGAWIG